MMIDKVLPTNLGLVRVLLFSQEECQLSGTVHPYKKSVQCDPFITHKTHTYSKVHTGCIYVAVVWSNTPKRGLLSNKV